VSRVMPCHSRIRCMSPRPSLQALPVRPCELGRGFQAVCRRIPSFRQLRYRARGGFLDSSLIPSPSSAGSLPPWAAPPPRLAGALHTLPGLVFHGLSIRTFSFPIVTCAVHHSHCALHLPCRILFVCPIQVFVPAFPYGRKFLGKYSPENEHK
jgi:hypothetical protein